MGVIFPLLFSSSPLAVISLTLAQNNKRPSVIHALSITTPSTSTTTSFGTGFPTTPKHCTIIEKVSFHVLSPALNSPLSLKMLN